MMAIRAKILQVVLLAAIGTVLVLYSSYMNGPVLIYHCVTTVQIENSTGIVMVKETNATTKVLEVEKSAAGSRSSSSASVVQRIPLKVISENQTFDKTSQGIITESIYDSGYDIPNADLCPELGGRLKVLVGVMSAPSHHDARMAIRHTWGHYALRQDVSLGFIVGTSKVASINNLTSQESLVYGDIIRGNFFDSYDNLTLKTISFLGWIDDYCSQVRFILKTDDDMFINFTKLLSFIDKHWKQEKTIFGRLAKKWKPIRNRKSKYFVSSKQFSHPIYPDFTTGPAYLMTGDIVHKMYTTALKSTYLKLEDVFTTGIVAQSINVKRIHINEFINKRIPFNICNIKKSISIHMIKFHEQFDLWKKLLDGRSKCK